MGREPNMTQMTWAQFKIIIDAELKEKGISEDSPIWYIDVSFMDATDKLEPFLDDDCGILIYT